MDRPRKIVCAVCARPLNGVIPAIDETVICRSALCVAAVRGALPSPKAA